MRLRALWTTWGRDAIGVAMAAGLSSLGAVLALRLWHMHLNIPLRYHSDTMLSLMTVRNLQTTGSFQTSDLLNAPLGQSLLAYPSAAGDLWNVLGLRALSTTLSPAATINVFYLLGFPAAAATAYAALRVLRTSIPVAVALGAVYSWLPYHFLRSEYHLFLSNYAAVPLLCIVAIALYRLAPGSLLRTWRWGVALATAVLLGGTGLYYAAFAVVLWAGSGLLAALGRRTWLPLLAAAALSATTVAVVVASAWSNLLYARANGTSAVEGRGYLAAEFYGLKLANLVLPISSHRIPAFAAARQATGNTAIPGEGSETLGVLGTAGFLLAVLALLLPVIVGASTRLRHQRELGALITGAFFVATVAGFSAIAAAAGFGLLRAWNRISVVIAFLALAALAVSLDAVIRRSTARRPRWHPFVAWPLAAALSVVGLLDQTSDDYIPDYAGVTAGWQADREFYTSLENDLGPGTAVFQLPRADFPEVPPVQSLDPYDLLTGYVHAPTLRWSFGGVKGGDVEWQREALREGVGPALPAIVSTGFRAILIDRRGYADSGAAVEAEIRGIVGDVRSWENRDRSVVVLDIAQYADRLIASGDLPDATEVLTAPRLTFGSGFYGEETDGNVTWQWAASPSSATLTNPGERRKVVLSGDLSTADANAAVTVQVGDDAFALRTTDHNLTFSLTVEVPPGASTLTLTTTSSATPSTAADPRDLRMRIYSLSVAAAG